MGLSEQTSELQKNYNSSHVKKQLTVISDTFKGTLASSNDRSLENENSSESKEVKLAPIDSVEGLLFLFLL
jgi:hypothetical protein